MKPVLALLILLLPAVALARECQKEPIPHCEEGQVWDAETQRCVLLSG